MQGSRERSRSRSRSRNETPGYFQGADPLGSNSKGRGRPQVLRSENRERERERDQRRRPLRFVSSYLESRPDLDPGATFPTIRAGSRDRLERDARPERSYATPQYSMEEARDG